MQNKKVYTGFDLIKLFAAVCIIAIHTKAPFLNVIGRLGVPFFAIVSSVLFFNHYQQLFSYKEQIYYLKKFCKRIFLLYISWQLLYLPIAIRQFKVITSSLGGIDIKSIFTYMIDFIFPAIYNSHGIDVTKDANGWGPSWYLLASIVAMPVVVYLLKLFHQRVLPMLIVCVAIESYLVLADEFNFLTHLDPIFNHTFLRLLIYFYLGYLIIQYRDQFNSYSFGFIKVLLVLFLLLFFIENLFAYYYNGTFNTEEVITTVPTGLILAIFAMRLHPNLQHPVQVRNLSTFLYCFQIWPIVIIRKLFVLMGWGNFHLLLFIIVLMISFIVAVLYERISQRYSWRFLKYMV